ncbi:hypothetical protein GN956_G4203 [Arapaima gigas]
MARVAEEHPLLSAPEVDLSDGSKRRAREKQQFEPLGSALPLRKKKQKSYRLFSYLAITARSPFCVSLFSFTEKRMFTSGVHMPVDFTADFVWSWKC